MKRKSHILMFILFWIFISSVTAKGELLQLTKGSLNGVQPDISRYLDDFDLAEGRAYTGYLTFDMDGTYNVWAQIDTDDEETEENESHNIAGPPPSDN
ncbi:MAG TPA: hypothetical protein ENG51_05785 [Deltaproteobacteria bacterium]|nr:hypothetical protein [Deltaproteobacteria bacterium]